MFKYVLIISVFLSACTRSHLGPNDVLFGLTFSSKSVAGDGTPITISVNLNGNADSTRRNILFSASDGSFINGKDSSISQKAVFVDQQLVAKVSYRPPLHPGIIYFTVRPDLNSYTDVSLTDSITVLSSAPAKIKVSSTSFSVRYGFLSEDTLTAKLSNADGGGVSMGTNVVFEDYYPSGDSAYGRYRQRLTSSNANSQVSTIYSPGFGVQVGRDIYLKVTVLDGTTKTAIKDSVLITVIQ